MLHGRVYGPMFQGYWLDPGRSAGSERNVLATDEGAELLTPSPVLWC